uniref:CKAP2_C domain-containing protein n=1 Tax=Caenorhabditis tropicalis TaxID=1561998 RepID=A0A1I7UTT8_9PELO
MSTFATAGLYSNTLESMMFSPTADKSQEKKRFRDEDLLKKNKSVSRLVEKFECGQLDQTIDEALEKMSMEPTEVPPTPKPRTKLSAKATGGVPRSIEDFYQGIQKTSSPIPKIPELLVTPEPIKVIEYLQETPILTKKSVPRALNSEILCSKQEKMEFLRVNEPVTTSKALPVTPILKASKKVNHEILNSQQDKMEPLRPYYSPLRSRDSIVVRHEQMRSFRTEQGSTCSLESSGSTVSTPSEPSTSMDYSTGSPATGTKEMDIYHKLARAQIHQVFPKFYNWDEETLRTISEQVSLIRLQALQEAPQDTKTRTMMTIYQKCVDGEVTKEMDALTASIFDLMDSHVHEKQISIFEEFIVMKYSKKLYS